MGNALNISTYRGPTGNKLLLLVPLEFYLLKFNTGDQAMHQCGPASNPQVRTVLDGNQWWIPVMDGCAKGLGAASASLLERRSSSILIG